MGVRYRYLLSLIVYLLVFNSISTVILHNEIVIETSSSSSSSPTDTSSQSSSQTSNEAADLKKPVDDPDPGVEKLVEVPPAAPDVVNDAQSQSQSNEPTPPNSPSSPSQTTTSESGETVESSAQISPPTDQTNQTAEANSTTTNKSSQAEMVRAAAGVVVVNKAGGEEMQSFEEWKEMRLKSSSSSAQDKSTTSTSSSSSTDPNSAGSAESATSGSGLPITSSSTQTASQSAHEDSPHQRRKNYASAECGAKIIASNPESNKPSNILSENKDDYMLNSCSNRVWFVIELCEPIRVIELELANFELFSNVPKQFRVYASERYVASSASSPNWPQKYLVGTFEAANVRTVQKFAIKDAIKETTSTTSTNQVDVNQSQQPNSSSPSSEQPNSNSHLLHNQNILMYAKYVRFEMLSHYGSEHYCPLSLVRIFGTSISDDEEAAAAAVSSSETDEVESRSIHVESSSSTTQATTTTTKNDKDEEKVNFLNLRLVKERVNLFAKSSQFLSNIIATFLAENFNLSKLFTVFSSNTDKNAANSASTTFSPPSTDSTSTTQQPDTSSSTKLTTLPPFDRRNQMLQIDLHKVLCFSSMRNTFDCCQCLPEDDEKSSTTATFMIRPYQSTTTTTTNNWMSKYCGYYFLMITSAQAQLNTSLLFKFLNNIKYSNGEAPLQLHPSNFTRFSLNNVNYYILNEWLDNQTAAHFYFKKSPSSETNPTPQSEEHSTLNLNMFASSLDGRNITSPPIIEPNEVNETNENSNSNSTTEVKPTPTTIDETPSIESTPQQQQSQEEPVVDVNEGSKNVETSTSSPPPPPPENQDTTSTSTSTSTNNNNAQIPTVVTPVIIGNGKDAVLMRLSNRVKILELNMTLSSQYLEKLSQHYKKQMDEMQRAFNVTTSALLETIRIADERDLKQNERIVTIERRVEKMQNSMEALENLLNDLKFQTDILIWTIIIILNIIILIEVVRWLRNAFSSSSPSPSGKPSKTLNRSISSQQSSARIHLSASEIEALIEERVRRATESLREELIEQQRQKQFTTTTTMTEPPSTPQRVETLTSTTTTTLESAMAQPQAAAAAAAVVSSTLATVVAIAAAATAQCSTLGAQHHGEEKS